MGEPAISAGFGYQYGGVLGTKYTIKNGQDSYFASIGLVGVAAGYQRFLDDDATKAFGIVLGTEVLTSEEGFAAITYNYYPQGYGNKGWGFGLSAGVRRTDSDPINISGLFGQPAETDNKGLVGINFGYTF